VRHLCARGWSARHRLGRERHAPRGAAVGARAADAAAGMSGRWLKLALGTAALMGLVWLVRSVWDHDAFMAWIGRVRPIPFFSLMSLLPAVGVPITPFFVVAGATYGARLGLLGSLIAIGANLALCYWVARTMRPAVAALFRRVGYSLPPMG